MRLIYLKNAFAVQFAFSKTTTTSSTLLPSRRFTSSFSRIENILIIGAGFMGSGNSDVMQFSLYWNTYIFSFLGIAQSCAFSDRFNTVTLHDISLVQLSKARARIVQNLSRNVDPSIQSESGSTSIPKLIYSLPLQSMTPKLLLTELQCPQSITLRAMLPRICWSLKPFLKCYC